jgi:hypothetical protein
MAGEEVRQPLGEFGGFQGQRDELAQSAGQEPVADRALLDEDRRDEEDRRGERAVRRSVEKRCQVGLGLCVEEDQVEGEVVECRLELPGRLGDPEQVGFAGRFEKGCSECPVRAEEQYVVDRRVSHCWLLGGAIQI